MKNQRATKKPVSALTENIKVMVRMRPCTSNESSSLSNCIKIEGKSISTTNSKGEQKKFDFDYVAGPESKQEQIFENCSLPLCEAALDGYNCTIFAYGQTGSGKTYTLLGKDFSESENLNGYKDRCRILPMQHTMSTHKDFTQVRNMLPENQLDPTLNNCANQNLKMNSLNLQLSGNKKDQNKMEIDDAEDNNGPFSECDENFGLLPRSILYLFYASSKRESKITFQCSYIEIYQDNIYDLLDPTYGKKVTLRDVSSSNLKGNQNSIVLEGMTKFKISSPVEAFNIVKQGSKLRHIAETAMNRESSRSHAIFTLYITNETVEDKKKIITKSMFHIIDLAGSERQGQTKTEGDRIKEAGKINNSLMNLGKVIAALINKKQGYIPYRDSKLTHILKDSLGGNAKTSIIANISPLNASIEETLSTLNFAQRAKSVKNQVSINSELSSVDSIIKKEFIKLKGSYEQMRQENLRLIKELEKTKNFKGKINKNDSNLGDDMAALEKEISKKEEELKSMQETYDSLKDQLNKKELDQEIMQKDMKDIEQENTSLKNRVEEKKRTAAQYATQNALLFKQNNDLTKALQEKENSNNLVVDELNRKINEYKMIIQAKDNTINSMTGQQTKDSNIIIEKNGKINQIQNLLNQEKANVVAKNNEIRSIKEEKDQLSVKIAELGLSIVQKDNEIAAKNKTLDELKTKGKNAMQKYDEQIGKLQKEIQEKSAEIVKFSKVTADLKELCSKKDEEINQRINGLTKFEQQLREEFLKAAATGKEIFDLKEENKQLKERLKELTEKSDTSLLENDNENIIPNTLNHSKNLSKPNNQVSKNQNIFANPVAKKPSTKQIPNKTAFNGGFEKEKLLNKKLTKENENLKKDLQNIRNQFSGIDKKINLAEIAAKLENKDQEITNLKKSMYDSITSIRTIIDTIKNKIFSDMINLNDVYNNIIGINTIEDSIKIFLNELNKIIFGLINEANATKEKNSALEKRIENLTKELDIKGQISEIKVYKIVFESLNKEQNLSRQNPLDNINGNQSISMATGAFNLPSLASNPNSLGNGKRKYDDFMRGKGEFKNNIPKPLLNTSLCSKIKSTHNPKNANNSYLASNTQNTQNFLSNPSLSHQNENNFFGENNNNNTQAFGFNNNAEQKKNINLENQANESKDNRIYNQSNPQNNSFNFNFNNPSMNNNNNVNQNDNFLNINFTTMNNNNQNENQTQDNSNQGHQNPFFQTQDNSNQGNQNPFFQM